MLARSIRSVCSRLILTLVFAVTTAVFSGALSITWAATPPLSVDLQPGSDNGVYDDDNLTGVDTSTVDIVAATPGDTIRVYRGGVLLGEATPVDTTLSTYTFTAGQLVEGGNTITARSWDGVEESGDSPTLNIQLDQTGPRITAGTPTVPINVRTSSLDSVTVTFSEEIHYASGAGSFTLADIDVTGPGGPITPTGLDSLGGNEYSVTFATQTVVGTYTTAVGPDVEDIAGNLMDQDQNDTGGEDPEDVFAFDVELVDVDVVISSNISIPAGDMTYDSLAAYIAGATVTIDGTHTFASLHVDSSAKITHTAGQSTFNVTVIGDLIVETGGRISVDGKGHGSGSGPGAGQGGGYGGGGGAGYGGDGSDGGTGAYSMYGPAGYSHGSILDPISLGSGGGGTTQKPGGAGGGAVRLTVGGTILLDGEISSDGLDGEGAGYHNHSSGGGSGGSVYLTCGVLSGSGSITADAGTNPDWGGPRGGGSGGGRIAIYYDTMDYAGTMTATGSVGNEHGGAGTIYLKSSAAATGDLYIDNDGDAGKDTPIGKSESILNFSRLVVAAEGRAYVTNDCSLSVDTLTVPGGRFIKGNVTSLVVGQLDVGSGGYVVSYIPSTIVVNNDAVVRSGGMVTHTAAQNGFTAVINGDLIVEPGGRISVDGKGFGSGSGSGAGGGGGYGGGGGAGYGGDGSVGGGGTYGQYGPAGYSYGSILEPISLGSGGGSTTQQPGGAGGGAVRLTVGGTIFLDGEISSNGLDGAGAGYHNHSSGGGSGGSIYLTCGALSGSGSIKADAGTNPDWGGPRGGGSGGGRIAIYYDTMDYAGTMSATGSVGNEHGGAGTIYLKSSAATNGDLYIDNKGDAGKNTPIGKSEPILTFTRVDVVAEGRAYVTNECILSVDTLTLPDGRLTLGGGTSSDVGQATIGSGGRLTSYVQATLTVDDVIVGAGGYFLSDGLATFKVKNNFLVESGGTMSHTAGQSGLHAFIQGDLTVEAGGRISVDGTGYGSGQGPGAGGGGGYGGAGGGGYGGNGGRGGTGAFGMYGGGGNNYCPSTQPAELGSPGGGLSGGEAGGRGAGAVHLTVEGIFLLDGEISADGLNGVGAGYYNHSSGGGSGGHVYVSCNVLTGSGSITAEGGTTVDWGGPMGGGGGGGRIIFDVENDNFMGSISVTGGVGYQNGGDGTVTYLVSPSPLQLNKQIVSNHDCACDVKRWSFSAFAGQQIRLENVAMSAPDIRFDLYGPDDFLGFVGLNGQSPLVTIPETDAYTLIARTSDKTSSNTVFSFYLQETSVTDITTGVPHVGQVLGDGHAQLFRVELDVSQPMRVRLDDASLVNNNELYARFGLPPTRGDYDCRSDGPASPDQQLIVPMATAGTWYILVYGETVPDPGEITLLAEVKDVFLGSVSPSRHGAGIEMQMIMSGGGFTEGVLVELVDSLGYQWPASSIDVYSFDAMTATYTAGAVLPGVYSVSISKPGGDTDQLADVFEMLDSFDPGVPEIDLVVPGRIGVFGVATIWAEYSNSGENAMQAPLLVLRATQEEREPAIMRLADVVPPRGFWTSAMPEGFSTAVQFLGQGKTPGVLQPGESVSVPIQYAGMLRPWTQTPLTFTLSLLNATDTTPVDWYSLKDDMRPDDITSEVWDVLWQNFTAQTGATWGEYAEMLTDNAIYLARLGLQVTDIGDLLAFEFAQADGINVVGRLANSTDAFVPAPGLDLSFKRTFPYSISRRYSLGDFGRGWSHNWDMSLAVSSDGTVTITEPGGSRRIYQPDIRPGRGYFSMEGDFATLTDIGGGAFSLEEANGLVRVFLPDGKLDYVEDTNGNQIAAGYSGDLLTSLTHSAGQSLAIGYNLADRIETITDPDGRVTTFGYDGSNEHLTSVEFFDSLTVGYAYSIGNGDAREHALTEISLPCCSHQYFTYDDQGRLETSYKDGGAEWIGYSYDDAGMVAVTDSLSNTSEFYLDHRGLVVKTRDAKGNTTRMHYDEDYNLSRVTDPAGFSYDYEYDSEGNLTEVTDPLGNNTQFAYDGAFNRMTRLTDANGNSTDYGHDSFGNLTSITYPDSTVEGWGYDTEGNPTSWTNRRDTTTTYEFFDGDGRLTAKIYEDLSRVEYEYDTRGNLIYAIEGADTTQFHCDDKDRLQRITYPGERYLEYTYNAAGKRASSTNQLGHRLDYHYDSVGRLESITDETVSEIAHYYYAAAGRLERKDLGNGVYTTYAYDEAWQLTDLFNYAPDNSVLSSFIYTYDIRGRRTSMTTLDGLWEYEYDDLGQLTAWTAPSSRRVDYEYDPLGNRTAVTDSGVVTDYTTNEMNQYTQVGSTTYVFDDDGNMTQEIAPGGTTTYTYNDENRLIAVSSPSGNWVYTYDAFGNRVRVDDNGTETDYVIDPAGFGYVVGEYDHGTGDRIAYYDHGLGLLSRADTTNGSAFYTFDAIGSASGLTDTLGTVIYNYSFEPFGTKLDGALASENSFGFVGEYGVMEGGDKLDYMRARFFDKETGRFLSMDPAGLMGGHPNFYGYVEGDPISRVDPVGLWYISVQGGVGVGTSGTYWGGGFTIGPEGMRGVQCVGVGTPLPSVGVTISPFKAASGQFWETSVAFGTVFPAVTYGHSKWQAGSTMTNYGEVGIGTPGFYYALCRVSEPLGWSDVWSSLLPPPKSTVPPTGSEQTAARVPLFALDPNEKDGPAGYGPDRLVSRDALLPYRVEFENDSTATAPAQIVTITDQLDANLDWTTFELTEVGFGDVKIAAPENSQHFETSVPMTFDTVSFDIQIEAGIHLGTGEVYANFYSIDPATFLPPGVDYGFLPPEDSTGRGQGYFTFVIRPESGTPAGTRIANIAYITFDFQETIATNQIDPHDPGQGTDPEKEAFVTIAADSVMLRYRTPAFSSSDGSATWRRSRRRRRRRPRSA
jgi:RHS repeat-associated protein